VPGELPPEREAMTLPKKPLEPELNWDVNKIDGPMAISYYANATARKADRLSHYPLPTWLTKLIHQEISRAQIRGQEAFRSQVKRLLS
jgi:hypothetical protein